MDEISGELSEQPTGGDTGGQLATLGGLHTEVFEQQEQDLREYPDEPEAAESPLKNREQLAVYAAH
jgi:hypothetical protein